MKKITLVLVSTFIALSLNLNAQSAADKIFDTYYGTAGFTAVTMNKAMFEMISRMDASEDGTDVKFLILEKGDIITELVLIAGGPDEENALIVISGEIDLASIGSIAKSMDIEGLEQLEKLKEHK